MLKIISEEHDELGNSYSVSDGIASELSGLSSDAVIDDLERYLYL